MQTPALGDVSGLSLTVALAHVPSASPMKEEAAPPCTAVVEGDISTLGEAPSSVPDTQSWTLGYGPPASFPDVPVPASHGQWVHMGRGGHSCLNSVGPGMRAV